ncbi:two-component system chemotaxis response regulator CheB [Sporomusaceae bacterium BoRhaA]|uniref:protein-glutamate methylesterase/protein-glutamine glutaminase n=1 Tax=Pelorhabdus rhamnosifermentans TaxID=2772457 RepID=UPI001C060DCC|nr:chemotaxis response regulator protein-glutamate methylesterase [Pelorhabdus rhamnosifermentans]MBU2699980.1 two-component system chemotaxis response regulator CheB [Pelorhabdus rhamnosifermentans]
MIRVKKIKVLVVDDSLIFRETLAQKIAQDAFIEVVATASDAYMARDKILEFEPDVMTLDVEMPRMNGIEFLRKLIPQYPIAVVVVSSLGENVLDALNAGAVDFVTKPDLRSSRGIDAFVNELIVKIKIASSAKVMLRKNLTSPVSVARREGLVKRNGIIAMGASTGGTEAIAAVLKRLPVNMPGIVIVQHMPAGFTAMYANRLNNACPFEVKEAKTGDLVLPGRVLIAAGDYHMRVKRGAHEYSVECFLGERVNGHCPSVDVLFESVAQEVGRNAIGIILTGMGYDGAKGLLSMKKNGARTIGQDEASSIVYGMPKVAFNIGAVERQASLAAIPQVLCSLLG